MFATHPCQKWSCALSFNSVCWRVKVSKNMCALRFLTFLNGLYRRKNIRTYVLLCLQIMKWVRNCTPRFINSHLGRKCHTRVQNLWETDLSSHRPPPPFSTPHTVKAKVVNTDPRQLWTNLQSSPCRCLTWYPWVRIQKPVHSNLRHSK
jgi:hypothetical protein